MVVSIPRARVRGTHTHTHTHTHTYTLVNKVGESDSRLLSYVPRHFHIKTARKTVDATHCRVLYACVGSLARCHVQESGRASRKKGNFIKCAKLKLSERVIAWVI
jgi:hypothetical protein